MQKEEEEGTLHPQSRQCAAVLHGFRLYSKPSPAIYHHRDNLFLGLVVVTSDILRDIL